MKSSGPPPPLGVGLQRQPWTERLHFGTIHLWGIDRCCDVPGDESHLHSPSKRGLKRVKDVLDRAR